MYGYLSSFLFVSTMVCFTSSFGDLYNRQSQRRGADFAPNFQNDRELFPPERREIGHTHFNGHNVPYNTDHNSHVDPVRHTHTSTKVDLSEHEELQTRPTTIKNYIQPDSINMRNHFNISEDDEEEEDSNSRSSNKRKSQAYEEQTRMVYPSDLENITSVVSPRSSPLNSRNCSFGFCDEVDDYPIERVQRIISRATELRKFFTNDITSVPNLFNRFGEADTLCSTMSHTRFPKSAVNMQNIEQLLVNVDNYKQGIVYETCTSNGGPCMYAENFPNNFALTCVQKYTVRKLMVLGKESDNPIFDDFKIPSCCVCTVKKNVSP